MSMLDLADNGQGNPPPLGGDVAQGTLTLSSMIFSCFFLAAFLPADAFLGGMVTRTNQRLSGSAPLAACWRRRRSPSKL